jgi:hypothetical protein
VEKAEQDGQAQERRQEGEHGVISGAGVQVTRL